ncbi:AbrB/MazE/SpoVT family DNA-binding domain-containing protein [Streptomyces collinus]|uniref:AbrB/MazE/SpoVT family DNA-binding domain-containing protein n=1 Tax=Streptomyces collinus TaxID=42684 RepID=UPI0039817F34
MLREPTQLTIGDDGQVQLPLGLLAEAGLSPGSEVVAYSMGDGRITLRRAEDAISELLSTGQLT